MRRSICFILLTFGLIAVVFSEVSGKIKILYNGKEIDYTKGILLTKEGQLQIVMIYGVAPKKMEVILVNGKRPCSNIILTGEQVLEPIPVQPFLDSPCSIGGRLMISTDTDQHFFIEILQ